jgi:hypothetical protein
MGKISINTDSLKDKKDVARHKVNDGDNIFRILPPFGEKSNGYPYRKWSIAWLADPESGRRRPYATPFSFGGEECPVYEYCRAISDKKEKIEAQLTSKLEAQGHSEKEIKEIIKEKTKIFGEILYNLKPKTTYFYNAISKSGVVAILELKKTAHDLLKKLMAEYIKDYNQDPTSLLSEADDSGVWIKVTRTGKDRDTEYSVAKNQTKARDPNTGKIVWQDDQDPIPDNVVDNYNNLAYDLSSLYKSNSYESLKEILIANLIPLYEKNPELIMPGFEAEEVEVKPTEQPKTKTISQQPAKKAVVLKLEDDDDGKEDDDLPPAKTTKTKVQPVDEDIPMAKVRTKTSAKEDNNSILDYAEQLLNS